MNRRTWTLAAAVLVILLGSLALAGKKKAKKKPTTGSITGVISFKGTVPSYTPTDKTSDPKCPSVDPPEDHIAADAKGKLAGAYVVLSRADGKALPAATAPTEPFVISQDGCRYSPRVVGLITGQPVEIRNDDPTFHNVRAMRDSKVKFNLAQMAGAEPVIRDDLGGAGAVELQCDVHPWMHSYLFVTDHEFFAITGADGRYTFDGVPPGKYKVHAWYPGLGRRDSKKVTVKKGKKAKASVTLAQDDP